MTHIPEDIMDAAEAIHINYVMPDPTEVRLAIAEAILAERNRVLSTLPIAVEGKEPLDWEDPVTRAKVIYRARHLWNEDQYSCAWSDENREHYMIRAAFELAPSSPGKDGGQEVGAVGNEAAELARLRAISLDMQAGYIEAKERAEEAVKAANALQTEVDLLRSTIPQPASTALVERLTEALQKAEAVLSIYADPTGYADADGNQLEADAEEHEGLLAKEALEVVRSALSASQSTSREGESRG